VTRRWSADRSVSATVNAYFSTQPNAAVSRFSTYISTWSISKFCMVALGVITILHT